MECHKILLFFIWELLPRSIDRETNKSYKKLDNNKNNNSIFAWAASPLSAMTYQKELFNRSSELVKKEMLTPK